MNYWQIAAGSFGRDYGDQFVRFGMAFVGGDTQVKAMDEVAIGDRILLKRGRSEILAAGEVVEREGRHNGKNDKDWLRDFDGWDLRGYCFVRWHVPQKPVVAEGLTRATIQRVNIKGLRDVADRVIADNEPKISCDAEPGPTQDVSDERILSHLVRQGLRPGSAEELTQALNRIRLLAQYYFETNWDEVREHETRTFLVVPLLLALGWAEQQIKIELPVVERQRADVACFSKPYVENPGDCVMLIETKGFSQGLDYAPGQAREYARHFPNCKVILVSNGYCYKAFCRDGEGAFSQTAAAYLNLLHPKTAYPLDPTNVKGCLEALTLLLPNQGYAGSRDGRTL
jgi:hypothetical protein